MIPQSVRYEKFQGYFLLLIKSTHIALFDSVSLNQNPELLQHSIRRQKNTLKSP